MFNSETLEVGIGMAFLFLLMSLICTGIKEWIEGLLKWRAMDLERAIRVILDDQGGTLTTYLFAHPLISSLYQGQYDPSKLKASWMPDWFTKGNTSKYMAFRSRRNLPSYIPAAQFATALIDLVGRGPANVDAENAPHAPLTVPLLRERAAALSSPFLRRAVLSAIDHCDGDLKQLTENLQRWFDGSMDRASGWYKRRTQTVLFVVGLAAAAFLNVDALYVMGRLTADKTFRETVVSAAAKVEPPASGADSGHPPAKVDAPATGASGPRKPLDTAKEARDLLEQVEMPMGWLNDVKNADGSKSFLKVDQLCKADRSSGCVSSEYSVLRIGLGWLITAFAVMLGAPFWFDVLNKFMVIRSTVKPREKSPEEGSEDRPPAKIKNTAVPAAAPTPPAAPRPAIADVATTDATASALSFVPHQWSVANPLEVQL